MSFKFRQHLDHLLCIRACYCSGFTEVGEELGTGEIERWDLKHICCHCHRFEADVILSDNPTWCTTYSENLYIDHRKTLEMTWQ